MLYTNCSLPIEHSKIHLGVRRKETLNIDISVSGVSRVLSGSYDELTVRLRDDLNPYILKDPNDDGIYLILSSATGLSDGYGSIRMPKSMTGARVLARGSNQNRTRMGRYETLLMRAYEDNVVMVAWINSYHSHRRYYLVNDGRILVGDDIVELYRSVGLVPPFEIPLNWMEWREI